MKANLKNGFYDTKQATMLFKFSKLRRLPNKTGTVHTTDNLKLAKRTNPLIITASYGTAKRKNSRLASSLDSR